MAVIKGTSKRDVLTGTLKADTIYGFAGNDTIYGAVGNDVVRGGAGNDVIAGQSGNDRLLGEAGNDTLKGGDGNDTLIGGDGADTINGGAGIDTVDYSSATIPQLTVVHLTNPTISSGSALGDSFTSIENVVGTKFNDAIFGTGVANTFSGGDGDDDLWGYGGDDVLSGGIGEDNLYGFEGADTLLGGAGDDDLNPGDDSVKDHIDGGDGNDTVVYLSSSVGVEVAISVNANSIDPSADEIVSVENLIGSVHNDILTVGRGGTVNGANGDDAISGSVSSAIEDRTTEFLYGEQGADGFRIHHLTGYDIVADFTPGQPLVSGDKLIFSASEFANIQHSPSGTGASTALINIANAGPIAADRAAPQFIFDQVSSYLYFDEDGIGTSFAPVVVAYLDGFHGELTHGGPLLSVDEFAIV